VQLVQTPPTGGNSWIATGAVDVVLGTYATTVTAYAVCTA
jgi:hypothetical protein